MEDEIFWDQHGHWSHVKSQLAGPKLGRDKYERGQGVDARAWRELSVAPEMIGWFRHERTGSRVWWSGAAYVTCFPLRISLFFNRWNWNVRLTRQRHKSIIKQRSELLESDKGNGDVKIEGTCDYGNWERRWTRREAEATIREKANRKWLHFVCQFVLPFLLKS